MAGFSDAALLELFERHRNELRLHCYRMLGSSHDVDDMLQEAALRAWRGKDAILDLSSVRAWLYRITTNVCLDDLARRRRRNLPYEVTPPLADVGAGVLPPEPESFVEPCPQFWFETAASDPAARYEARESVALAFVAVLQQLTPSQRATLLLRDVVGLSADETAQALEMGLQAANSALFRARAAVEAKLSHLERAVIDPPSAATQRLLVRYLAAWNQLDADAFVALLHEEVRTTMPPSPTWIAGRARHVDFYRPMFEAQRPGSFVAAAIAANAPAAFAFYRALAPGEPHRLRAIQLVDVRDGAIIGIDHFMLPELGPAFRLPAELPTAEVDAIRDGRSDLELWPEHFSNRARSHE
jgi:RNA polymerase sigma-70 factor (ECF subfamily)